MNVNCNLVLISVVVMALLLLVGCSVKVASTPAAEPAVVSSPAESSPPLPVTEGKTITIRGCHADPELLYVTNAETVIFVNTDGQAHRIYLDSENLLPAKGTLSVIATASLPLPFTINYLCDAKSSGVIVIE